MKYISNESTLQRELYYSKTVPIVDDYDVIVIGAGVAGISAAVAAGRNGVRTLLVERDGCLGGTATTGLMTVFMGVSMSTIKGNFKEFLTRMEQVGGAYIADNTPFDPEIFKKVAEDWLLENNVELLYHATFSDVIKEGNTIKGVFLQLKEGLRAFNASVVIDASGDADVAASSGVEFQTSDYVQPMTSIFRMSNVNTPKLIEYIEKNPEQFFSLRGQVTWKLDHDPPFFTIGGFFDLIKQAREAGELSLPHDSIWLGPLPTEGHYFINTTRIGKLDGTKSFNLSKAEIELRKQMWEVVIFLVKSVPGFENASLLDSAVRVGVRETRRMVGEYILTGNDLIEGRSFDDAIVNYDFPMDIHGGIGKEQTHCWGLIEKPYDIPYRCIIAKVIDNLFVVGRCISVDSRAHGSTRSMPCCMATGEAAGVAASIACRSGIAPRNISYGELRELLVKQGVNLR